MNDRAKWEVYATYISSTDFKDGNRPDPNELAQLLQRLGVTLKDIEEYVEEYAGLDFDINTEDEKGDEDEK